MEDENSNTSVIFGYGKSVSMVQPESVSYTHLDVYKRQVQEAVKWFKTVVVR